MNSTPLLKPLWLAARRTERRLRTVEALQRLSRSIFWVLGAALAWEGAARFKFLGSHGLQVACALVFIATTLGAGASVAWAYVRAYPVWSGSLRLDQAHGLSDRITNALMFSTLPEAQQTALMHAAVADALAHAAGLSPTQAVPLRTPKPVLAGAIALGVSVGILWVPLPTRTPMSAPAAASAPPQLTLGADDLAFLQTLEQELQQKTNDPDVQDALDRFRTIVDDLTHGRLDPNEAMRRLVELEARLRSDATPDDGRALAEALRQRAAALKKNALTQPLGEALAKQNLREAHEELQKLAQKLEKEGAKVSPEERKKLQDALAAAAQKQTQNLANLRARRDELQKSLLQREQKPGASDEEKRLLERDRRELDRLDRDLQTQEKAQRQLDRLDRELSQAAADLMKDLGLSAHDLQRGAEDLDRMAQEELSQKEKEELRQRLEELREMLRQQGQGGDSLRERMRAFARKAQGKKGGQGAGASPGAGGEKKLMLKPGAAAGPPQPGGQSQPGGPPGGNSWGTGHDENVAGEKPSAENTEKFRTYDVQESAADTGQGPSVSETILGTAEKGFATRAYRRVYVDYRTKAEETIKTETIPSGYRFYLRRYFELIRPREDPTP